MHKESILLKAAFMAPWSGASDGGVVTIADDLNDGYGNYVVIDHGNGYKTLLRSRQRHFMLLKASMFLGQPILAVGNSGNSYGSHLHFEIIETEREVNPLNFDF